MKHIYLLLLILVTLSIVELNAQVIVSTNHIVNNGQNGVTFSVFNSNSYNVRIFGINSAAFTASPTLNSSIDVWYKLTTVKGPPGVINAANGWINAGNFVINRLYTTVNPYISNLAINIPSNGTARIFIGSSQTIGYMNLPAATVNTFTAAGVDLLTGDSISYGGPAAGPPTFHPRGFVGDVVFFQLDTCNAKPAVGSITSLEGIGFCSNQNKLYYLTGVVPHHGITYQWQSAPTLGGAYTNVGTNTTMFTRTANVNAFLRCIATCTSTGLRDTTLIFKDTLKPFYHCYCKPIILNTTFTKIDSTKFLTTKTGSLTTTCETYTDYTGLAIPKIRTGSILKVSSLDNSCTTTGPLTDFGSVFIDLNRSGVYDAAELMGGAAIAVSQTQWYEPSTVIPLTNPLGITGIRTTVQFGSAPVACTNTNWGETEDYLVEIIKDSFDLKMNSFLNLENGCDLTNTTISFNATNIGRINLNSVDVCYSINGSAAVCENLATLPSNATSNFNFATQANLAPNGIKIIKIWHNNPLDTNKTNDTITKTIVSFPIPPTPVADHDTVCVGAVVGILRAPSSDSFMTRWYADAAGNIDTNTGNEHVINNPNSNQTFYAKSVYSVTTNIGLTTPTLPEANAVGVGHATTFSVFSNKVTINSVDMKIESPGLMTFELRSPGNALLKTIIFGVPTAGTYTVPVNYRCPVGVGYRLVLTTNPGNIRGTLNFNSFPIVIPNVMSLTASTTAGFYGIFYNWNISYDACSSPIVPVNLVYISSTLNPKRVLPKDTFFCQFPDAYLYAADSPTYLYKWNDTTYNRSVKVKNSGLYIVTITNSVGCNVVDTSKVNVKPSPFFNLGNDTTICTGHTVNLKTGFTNKGYDHIWEKKHFIGPSTMNNIQWSNALGEGIIFNVLRSEVSLKSFKCRFDAVGNASVQIKDFNNNIVFTKLFYVDTANKEIKVFVDKKLTLGNGYKLILTSTPGNIASENPLTKFPFIVPNVFSITRNINPDTNKYDYFYDLEVTHSLNVSLGLESNINVNTFGIYVVNVYNTNTQCGFRDSLKVDYVKSPLVFLGTDTFVCNNTPITIYAPTNSNYDYTWDDGSKISSRTVPSTKKVWLNIIDVSTNYTCRNSDTLQVTIATLTKPVLPADTTTCGPSKVIGLPADPKLGYKWNYGETKSYMTARTTAAYILTVTEVNTTCSFSDTMNVTFIPSPILDLGRDTIVTCEPVMLSASSGFDSYNWGAQGTNQAITILSAGTYTVTASVAPCPNVNDKVVVIFDTVPNISLPKDTILCKNASLVLTIPTQPTSNKIEWFDGTKTGTTKTVNQSGQYWVSVQNDCGISSAAISIFKDTLPLANFNVYTSGAFVGFDNLSSGNIVSQSWNFGDTGTQNTSILPNATHDYKRSGTFTVKLTVKNFCGDSVIHTKIITVYKSSVQDNSADQLLIYPNPAQDELTISNRGIALNPFNLAIYSIDGKLVWNQNQCEFNSNSEFKVNLDQISNGNYMIKYTDNTNTPIIKKITIKK